eukprot:scaffold44907_cov64-Phaeocystis_antarctica.AAC.9
MNQQASRARLRPQRSSFTPCSLLTCFTTECRSAQRATATKSSRPKLKSDTRAHVLEVGS